MILQPVLSGGKSGGKLVLESTSFLNVVDSTGTKLNFTLPEEYEISQLVGFGIYSSTNVAGKLYAIPPNPYMAASIRYLAGIDETDPPQMAYGSIKFGNGSYADMCRVETTNSSVTGKTASLYIYAYATSPSIQQIFMDPSAGVQLSFAFLL